MGSNENNNWQSSKTTIKSRLSHMLNNKVLFDVHFIVGEIKECISAHQLILSMSSSVFFTMFNGSIPYTGDKIVLPDIEPGSFHAVLKYIYAEDIGFDPKTVIGTLYAARKYEILALEEECENFLIKIVNSATAFYFLSQAKFFDKTRLMEHCLTFIDQQAATSVAAVGFTDIDRDLLSTVLKRTSLCLAEIRIFEAVVRWAIAECQRKKLESNSENQRTVLGDVFSLIRFPLMTLADFASGPVKSGLLTDKECIDLFVYFSVTPKLAVPFSAVPRNTYATVGSNPHSHQSFSTGQTGFTSIFGGQAATRGGPYGSHLRTL